MNKEKIVSCIVDILREIGDDPVREGLLETPDRVARMYQEIFGGYEKDPKEVLEKSFDVIESYNGCYDSQDCKIEPNMVVVKDIEFYSHCEHHMVPFIGKVHIGYIPNRRVVGLSKLVRLVEILSHRLQIQERLTEQIADTIDEALKPQGVIVVIEAQHMCMKLRGVKNSSATTTTSAIRGAFHGAKTRAEFLELIK